MALHQRAANIVENVSSGSRTTVTRSIIICAPLSDTRFGRSGLFLQLMRAIGNETTNTSTSGKEPNDSVHRTGIVVVRAVSIAQQHAVEADSNGGGDIDATQWWLTVTLMMRATVSMGSMEDVSIRSPTIRTRRMMTKASGSGAGLTNIWWFGRLTEDNQPMMTHTRAQ